MTVFRTSRLSILAAGIAVAAGLTLAGCSAPAPAPNAGAGSSAAPASGSTSASSSSVSLPDGFPSDKVPIIPGTILHANHTGNIWGVWVASSDLAGDMAKATQLLVDAGYDNVIPGTSYADFHGTEYQVHVTAKDDPKYGPSIAYAFYHVQ
jgi:hypothetical protein